MSNITKIDTLKRLHAVKSLIDDEKTDFEIAETLGMSLRTVQRNRKYLSDLAVADLTNNEIAQKREELYLELLEATNDIRQLFEFYRDAKLCPICKGEGVVNYKTKNKQGIESPAQRGCGVCNGKGVLHFPKDAQRFFSSWLEAIDMRAKLYGLDTMKVESLTQLNQFNQYNSVPERLDGESGRLLADMLKKNHEDRLKKIA